MYTFTLESINPQVAGNLIVNPGILNKLPLAKRKPYLHGISEPSFFVFFPSLHPNVFGVNLGFDVRFLSSLRPKKITFLANMPSKAFNTSLPPPLLDFI